MNEKNRISLVIPVFNEEKDIHTLIATINTQSVQPDEIILVDGGSTDNTVQRAADLTKNDPRYSIIEAGRAMPGRGRNIGAKKATGEWIAFTDAGIKLDTHWLGNLVRTAALNDNISIIYGNYSPEIKNLFDTCATITYVAPMLPGKIRGKFIASSLFKKEVWEKAGGFPEWRAAEDLIFMENAEKLGYQIAYVPEAMVHWQLRPGPMSTYRRFDLYSMYNVWAGRQPYWHYGVAKQYLFVTIFILLAVFHHWLWLLAIPLWLMARTAKRLWIHRYEFGRKTLFNPAVFFTVLFLTIVIDMATFSGWIKAILHKPIPAGNN